MSNPIWQPDETKCPDMQALVEYYGRWDLIPADAWTEFREAKDLWRQRHCAGEFWRRPILKEAAE